MHEKLFLAPKATEKTAGTQYQEQLMGIVALHKEEVANHIRLDHMNAYGLRKGSATLAVSGTTSPPQVTSIARRGEWSMGKVLDVYWHCVEPGDSYLGRLLSSINPLSPDFNVLPPHFDLESPMEDEDIHEAMELMYGPILLKWQGTPQDHSGVLLRLLTSVFR